MPNPAIIVESLGKRYRIGAAAARPRSLKEALVRIGVAPVRNLQRLRQLSSFGDGDEPSVIWALRDVSFELQHGDVLGVIGRNGAGKSTLLKVLSRITKPTTGRARIAGRVGSLLEVGTGFHPELTGRDNVYLNGAILGMRHNDVARKFDEIVEFAGVGRFIDTPVKRYSSGMHVRLAFAVAAHLEPDVLIVDEVLAVGDAEFQQKCLLRMDGVAREGRTVLFVSHNLGAVQRLCTRALLLEDGHVTADGQTTAVVKQYLVGAGAEAAAGVWIDVTSAKRRGSGAARITGVRYASPKSSIGFRPYPGGPLEIALRVDSTIAIPRVNIGFTLRDHLGGTLMSGSTRASGSRDALARGVSTWRFRLASLFLRPGPYELELWLDDASGMHDQLQPALRLDVFDHHERGWEPSFDPRHDGPVFCQYEVSPVQDQPEAALAQPLR